VFKSALSMFIKSVKSPIPSADKSLGVMNELEFVK
jgi:hypothetical protein